MPIRIVPKKKPNRVYMTDDNSGVIYSDKKGNVISKEQAMKGFDDADAAERREERRSSQYKKMKRGGMATQRKAEVMTAKEMMNNLKFSDKDRADESKTKIKYKANLRDLVKTDYKKMKTGGEAKKKDKGQINPGEKFDNEMREFSKKLDKRGAKYEMVSKFQKRTGRSFPSALNSIEVQKIMDKGKTGYDDISVTDLAKKEGSFSKGGSIMKVPGGYSKEGSGRISDKGLKGRSPQQVFSEKEKRMENTKPQGMTKKMKGGGIAIKGTNFKGVF